MNDQQNYYVLAYYQFVMIEDPHLEVKRQHEFFLGRDVKGRIYISEEGINAQMSGSKADVTDYIDWLRQDPRFYSTHFKLHSYHENVFPKMTVKYRKQLVALDRKVDMNRGGRHVSPQEWKEMLESDEEHVLVDVRNRYEWRIGRFEGADLPPCDNFREFPGYVNKLKERVDPKKTKIMMYCTGGIRCELYSALMKEEGFDDVVQLEGGIINYGLQEGQTHWKGKLFVFDDRLSIPLTDEKPELITSCDHCGCEEEVYYNCGNMDCNEFFICCDSCLHTYNGCCSALCLDTPRVRPLKEREGAKPFRKLHHYRQMREKESQGTKTVAGH